MVDVKENKGLLKKIGNITFYVVLGIVLIYSIFALFSDKEENQISFFGMTSLAVQSDSMAPTFNKGDLVFIDTSFDAEDLKEGDVITYLERDGDLIYYNTHRIVGVHSDGTRFETKGDAASDDDPSDPIWKTQDDIIGVWTGRSWGGFGSFVDGFTGFIKSSTGFFLLIVVPALLFLGYEVYRFIKVYGDYNRKKGAIDREALKEQAIAEAKRQLEEEQKSKD
jgi:signal peptidase